VSPTRRVANAPGSVDAGHRCSFTVDATHEKNPPGATGRHARGCRQQQRGSGTGHGALRRVVKGVEPDRPRASRHGRTGDRCRRREHPARPPHPQITDQQPITRARAATPSNPIPCHSHLRTNRQTATRGLWDAPMRSPCAGRRPTHSTRNGTDTRRSGQRTDRGNRGFPAVNVPLGDPAAAGAGRTPHRAVPWLEQPPTSATNSPDTTGVELAA
jgi:hypothetical protein